MTDEQITKALECCKIGECDDCPFYGVKEDCEVELPEDALDLINRQKVRIKELKERISYLEESIDCSRKEYNRLLQKMQQLKSEAIKEFAERLRAKAEMYNSEDVEEGDLIDDLLTVGEIVEIVDNLVKEMTEVQE